MSRVWTTLWQSWGRNCFIHATLLQLGSYIGRERRQSHVADGEELAAEVAMRKAAVDWYKALPLTSPQI